MFGSDGHAGTGQQDAENVKKFYLGQEVLVQYQGGDVLVKRPHVDRSALGHHRLSGH